MKAEITNDLNSIRRTTAKSDRVIKYVVTEAALKILFEELDKRGTHSSKKVNASYRILKGPMEAYAASFLWGIDKAFAKDIVKQCWQEFYKMHHKGKRWDPNRLPFRNPWFFSILRRVALSMVRKQAQFQFRFKGHSPSEWAHNINPAFITERRDTEETVHASIKELRPRDALFILAVFFNGTIDPSISPAGRHMGLHRAKQRLRKILMRRGIEGPC